jgi:ADP-heptose:LPS heptosyltransferase
MDFFTFRRGAIGALPAFAIGRPAWDNYLIKQLLRRRIPIVDLSHVVVPIHQKHDYAHVAQRRDNSWEGPEGDRNRALADAASSRFDPQYYTIDVAQWIMLDRVTVPAVSPRRLWRRFLAVVPDHVRYPASLFRRAWPVLARLADLYIATLPFRMLPRRVNKIAVVRLDNIGDFILWLDGARAIRTRYPRPDYQVALIASSKWSEFAESSGLFDEIIAVDPERLIREARYCKAICYRIAKRRFGTTINPTVSRSPRTDDFLVKAAGASTSIGYVGDLSNAPIRLKTITDRWYTELVPIPNATHELAKNCSFAKRFDPQIVLRGPKLEPAMINRPPWLPDGHGYFVLFPGAAWPIKLWPAERFGEIAARIHTKTGWTGLVCGTLSDLGVAKKLITNAKNAPITDACGRTTLTELAGVIAGAKLTVTNDTSAAHLAAALRVPAVVILGGGHFGRFLPYPAECESANGNLRVAYHSMPCYQCNWRCVYARQPNEPGPCIASVTVEDVWALVDPFLSSDLDASQRMENIPRSTPE